MASTPIPLSRSLLCTYIQYKHDSETVAGWLKANAIKHGYAFGGKDGTAIHTSDFVPMAQHIVASIKKPLFTLQPSIHLAFRRAIIARRKCTAWYEEHTQGQWRKNETHTYFTNILLSAWDVLLRHSSNASKPNSKSIPAQTEGKDSIPTNRFAALYLNYKDDDEVELPNDSTTTSDLVGKGKNASKNSGTVPTARIIPDESQVEEEFWFAVQSFLQEQQQIRQIVKGYWRDYRDGKTDLIMASLGTRTAIDLIRRSEIELDLRVTRPQRFPADKYPVWTFPALLIGMQQGLAGDPVDLKQLVEVPKVQFVPISGPEAKLTHYNVYATLRTWSRTKLDDEGKKKQAFVYDKECVAVLKRILCFEWIVENGAPPYEDEVTKGVREAFLNQQVPIWTVFGLRLLLDTERILKCSPEQPWEETLRQVTTLCEALPNHWHHRPGTRHVALVGEEPAQSSTQDTHNGHPNHARVKKKNTSMLQRVMSTRGPRMKGMVKKRAPKKRRVMKPDDTEKTGVQECNGDIIRCGYEMFDRNILVAKKWVGGSLGDMGPNTPPYKYMKRNPLHCGLIKYDLYRSRQWSALYQNTSNYRDTWAMLYIYAAGRSVFPDSLAWPDLEFLLHQQGEKHVFFGGRPSNIEWAARKWLLALGNSSRDLSYFYLSEVLKCPKLRFLNPKKWRPLHDSSALAEFVSSRINCCELHRADDRDNFMEMVRRMHSKDALLRLTRMLDMGPDQAKEFVASWTDRLLSWTLKDILELTQLYLAVDLADIGFDWAALDSTCSNMWREVSPMFRSKDAGDKPDAGGHTGAEKSCQDEKCTVGFQPTNWAAIALCQAAEVEVKLSARKKRDPAALAEELEKGSPAFMKLWSLIQGHCRKRINTPVGQGIFSSFAAEAGLVSLMTMNPKGVFPAIIVAPHVQRCFEGYPDSLVKQSTSMKLAKKMLASKAELPGILKKNGVGKVEKAG